MNGTTQLGERIGNDRLVYNPLVYRFFHEQALMNGPLLAKALVGEFPEVRTVAEVGCGTGVLARELMKQGCDVIGYEYSARARRYAAKQGVEVYPFELAAHLDQRLAGRPFDLASSFEVAEHVPEFLAGHLVRFLATASPLVVMSAAPPGQGGHGHINEQPKSYWIDKFERLGFPSQDEAMKSLTERCEVLGVANWLSGNLMVFRSDSGAVLAD